MKLKSRWIENLFLETDVCEAPLPWQRGSRRRAMIARREEAVARARARVIAIQDAAARLSA